MFIHIILSIVCIVILMKCQIYKNNSREYISDNNINSMEVINYDLWDNKQYLLLLIAAFLGLLISIMTSMLFSLGFSERSFDIQTIGSFAFTVFFAVLSVYGIIKYVKCTNYLNDLKRQGYILPEKKADYQYSIGKLLKDGTETLSQDEPLRDKGAIIEAIICLVVFVGLLIFNCYFVKHYYYYFDGKDRELSNILLLSVPDLFWLIMALVYYIKSDNRKYKNQSQDINGRKNRTNVYGFIAFLLVFLGITCYAKNLVHTFKDYVFKTHFAYNEAFADSIRVAFNDANSECENIPQDVIDELYEGADITVWENDSEYKAYLLHKLYLDSFAEITSNISNAYDTPRVIVTVRDDITEVEIQNVYTRDVLDK